ncbi:hypothetical protein C5167_005991 [Papaver somniferum]|uniref:Uncharacterized protein n=1 Tax=Papaver somniferum TaxID=3469 RepID=A0A4Y7JDR9_PAPSO|nr:hypothetical protein C5167_005991 [Papaver somniferum]
MKNELASEKDRRRRIIGNLSVVTPIAPLSQQVQERFEALKKRKVEGVFTEQDLDERTQKQQQEEEERKRQRRKKKKEKKASN